MLKRKRHGVRQREDDGVPVSPFHDIPLFADKDEGKVSRSKSPNPISQDILDREPRFTTGCFPHKGYLWKYGALSQVSDNDPLDACEIGHTIAQMGGVKQVRVLGVLGLLDNSETDWKVMVVDVTNPLAEKLHDIADAEKRLPDNTTLDGTPGKLDPGGTDLPADKHLTLAPIKQDLGEWCFVD
ncbi:inorganic pyrophosphatase [Lasiosphaeria miniovina]|uniref:inorganic diphosphatase n=1 Tax=Lasiosphaeria miniovina TaxID=1954250 RepID=A0AA40ATL7_9PEZI|nr:inorganic pyrophosphatase [Lasiosphaeria miniovina]KAK0721763.1 inorganic pyrophosphatase [Lasiosphaeria miniovina]